MTDDDPQLKRETLKEIRPLKTGQRMKTTTTMPAKVEIGTTQWVELEVIDDDTVEVRRVSAHPKQ